MEQPKKLNMALDDEDGSRIVTPKNGRTLREIVRPARTLARANWKKLDGAMDEAIVGAEGGVELIPETNPFALHGFAGYGVLQSLSQDSMIRLLILTRTTEMLRRWIEFKDEDSKRIEEIEDYINRTHLRDVLQLAVNTMGFMGGSYIFIDTGEPTENLVNPIDLSERSGSFGTNKPLAFRVIDPIFTAPQQFNAVNPLVEDFYKPNVFMVNGTPVHRSRLIRFVENEVCDLLKPSYNFLGLPQSQILDDYVKDFRKNRESANRLLNKFSCSFIKTNISDWLYSKGSRAAVEKRVRNFIRFRNNDGIGLLDFDSEDFIQANTPLSGVDALVSQSLQFCVAVNRTNVVKTLGLSPAGFNTGDSDIKVHNDMIASLQEQVLRKPLEKMLKCIMLHLYGKIEDVTFDFRPLNEEDERTLADTQKVKADTAAVLLANDVVTPDEVRDALRNDEKSAFSGIEGDAPEATEIPFPQDGLNNGGKNDKDADGKPSASEGGKA